MRGLDDAVVPRFPGGCQMVWHLRADIGLEMICSLNMRRFAPHAF